jgi:teichuronic acid biosynthesis glycosyltransferase TuaH
MTSRDVVFTFSAESLADVLEREFCRPPDQALLALCRNPDRIRRVAVANPWRSAPISLMRTAASLGNNKARLDGVILIRPLRVRRRDPTRLRTIKRSYRKYDGILERRARKVGLKDPIVLTFNPFVAAFCPLRWASSVTFYARDDFSEGTLETRWRSAHLEAYEAIRNRGARIICVSAELASRVAGNRRAVVLPNGIDENWWLEPVEPPAVFSGLQRPIVTYMGTIDQRTDVRLVADIARQRGIGSIAFIGPIGDRATADELRSIQKVSLLGNMGRAGVVGSLMNSDAGIIPHIISPLTRAMSPLKLYEYLAAGKPVAATDLPPVTGISKRVVVGSDGDFTKAVLTALEFPPQPEEERLEFVRANSWAARQERMLKVLLADDKEWWAC